MCSGASLRRRLLRLGLGVNRKLILTRWNGNTTVGVVRTSGSCSSYLKASEGAEKSLRKQKRVRGQRKGKKRSRGRQPRSNSPPPAPVHKEMKERTMMKHLRACDHWYDRQEQFGELFKVSSLYRQSIGPHRIYLPESLVLYRSWRLRWQKLRSRILPCGDGVVWCSRIGPSFSYWLEQRFGILIETRSSDMRHRALMNASSSLHDMVEDLRIRQYTPPAPLKRRRAGALYPKKRNAVYVEPHQLYSGKRVLCSVCGSPAVSWNNHYCVQSYRRSTRSGRGS